MLVVHSLGEVLLQLRHRGADRARELQRVGARGLKDADPDRLLVVEHRAEGIAPRGQLDARHVPEPGQLPVRSGLDDDLPELLLVDQAATRVHRELVVHSLRHRRRADHAGRDLHVLLPDGAHHVARGEPARGDLLRVEPDPHRIVAATEHLDLAHARDPPDDVLDLEQGVVPQVNHVVPVVGRDQVHHHDEVGRALDRGDARLAHFLRQPGQRLGHPVLHLDLRQVHVGADAEGDRGGEHAVRRCRWTTCTACSRPR